LPDRPRLRVWGAPRSWAAGSRSNGGGGSGVAGCRRDRVPARRRSRHEPGPPRPCEPAEFVYEVGRRPIGPAAPTGVCAETPSPYIASHQRSQHRVVPTLPTSRRTNAPSRESGAASLQGAGFDRTERRAAAENAFPSSHTKLVAAAPPVQGPARGLLDPCRAPDAGTRPRQRGHDNSAATERARRSFATKVPGSGDAVRVCGPRRISGAAPPRRRARAVTYALPGVCVRRSSAPGNRYGARGLSHCSLRPSQLAVASNSRSTPMLCMQWGRTSQSSR